jgi:YidC/Oxa1 family membrane protein insertase
MVAQLPVFLSLYYMLRTDLRRDICPEINPPGVPNPKPCGASGDSGFLFIPDLTNQAHGTVLIALIVLYVGSQLFSTLLMSTTTDRTQRMIFLALPFLFVLFVIRFPAGLLVYWITTNFWTVGQQYVIRRGAGLPVLGAPGSGPTPAAAGSAAAVPDKGGGGAKAKEPKERKEPKAKPKTSANGDDGAPQEQRDRRTSAPPPPPRQRRKKKTGRRR